MIASTYAAVKARLESDSQLAGRVYGSVRTTAKDELVRDQYVILYGSGGDDGDPSRYSGVEGQVEHEFDVRSVGTTPENCTAVMDRVRAVTSRHVFVVEGRMCWPARFMGGRVRADMSVKPYLFYADSVVEFTSQGV